MQKNTPKIIQILQAISKFLEKFALTIATIAGFVMLFSLLVGVFTRYLPFMTTAIWSEEIARMMMLWITTTGASVAFSKNNLVNFNLLIDVLPKKAHNVMNVINDILVLIVIGVLLYYGYDMLILKMRVFADATHMSYFWWALGFYIGFVCMAFHGIRHLVEDIYTITKKETGEEE